MKLFTLLPTLATLLVACGSEGTYEDPAPPEQSDGDAGADADVRDSDPPVSRTGTATPCPPDCDGGKS